MNLSKFPRRGYVQNPTPIEAMPTLSKSLGGKVNLYVKRDDLLPGAAGGNKTRKLDFSMADAVEKGADTVITCGAIQSNHCRLTLSMANKEGMDCYLILEERVKDTYDEQASGNNFLYQLLGVSEIKVVKKGADLMGEMEALRTRLLAEGKKPYIIPGGASNALGATGYVSCAQELLQQQFEQGLNIDHIVVPSGSGGTHAGMVVGMYGNRGNIPITGISVSRNTEQQTALIKKLAGETAQWLGMGEKVPNEASTCLDGYVGGGYSIPTDGMTEAVTMLARTESILLDPVYSGKAAAGLIDLVRNDYFNEGDNVLFLHTGGSPVLYEYMPTFRGAFH